MTKTICPNCGKNAAKDEYRYRYKCNSCDFRFIDYEAMHLDMSIGRAEILKCPWCNTVGQLIKKGFYSNKQKQRFRCKNCNRVCSETRLCRRERFQRKISLNKLHAINYSLRERDRQRWNKMSYAKIAKAYGVSKRTVIKAAKQLGLIN